MRSRWAGGALLLTIAVLCAWLVLGRKPPSGNERSASTPIETAVGERVATAAEAPSDERYPARPRTRTVASILAGRRNVMEGLTEALAVFGPKDPDLISAAGMALAACSQVQFAEHPSADPRMQDLRKIRALEKLHMQCEGFDHSFFKQLDTYEHKAEGDALMRSRVAGQPEIARRVIATSVSTLHLSSAGSALIDQKRLPLQQILGRPAPADSLSLIGNWYLAAELATCARQLGCGPDALPTLVVCMNLGHCEPGQGYVEALEKGLPAEDFRTVLAFRQWIARQRR
jgi:hypothetical protein